MVRFHVGRCRTTAISASPLIARAGPVPPPHSQNVAGATRLAVGRGEGDTRGAGFMATAAEEQAGGPPAGRRQRGGGRPADPQGVRPDRRRPDGRGPRADRAGAQGRRRRHRAGASRSGSTARSSGSPRSRSPPARGSTSTTSRPTCSSATTRFASERPPVPPPVEPRTFQGYPPARRPGRHAELRRRDQHGQLLGEHVAVHRRAVPRRRLEGRLPQRRRRLRDHPQGGVRPAVRGAGPPDRSSACWPGSPTIPTWPPT